jgi:hypothetical protein
MNMAVGEDVTDIGWEPPSKTEDGPGEVTIEHRVIDDVKAPMTQDDAGRLADRMFGAAKKELPHRGAGIHWGRGGLRPVRARKQRS